MHKKIATICVCIYVEFQDFRVLLPNSIGLSIEYTSSISNPDGLPIGRLIELIIGRISNFTLPEY